MTSSEFLFHQWGDVRAEEFDGVHHFFMRDAPRGQLNGYAGNSAEDFILIQYFGGDCFGITD